MDGMLRHVFAAAVAAGLVGIASTALAQGRGDIADESVRVLEGVGKKTAVMQENTDAFIAKVSVSMRNIGVVLNALASTEKGSAEERFLVGKGMTEIGRIYDTLNESIPRYLRTMEDLSDEVNDARFELRRLNETQVSFENQRGNIKRRWQACAGRARSLLQRMKEYKRSKKEIPDDMIFAYRNLRDCMAEMKFEMTSLGDEEALSNQIHATIGSYESSLSTLSRGMSRELRQKLQQFTRAIRRIHLMASRERGLTRGSRVIAQMEGTLQILAGLSSGFNDGLKLFDGILGGWGNIVNTTANRLKPGASQLSKASTKDFDVDSELESVLDKESEFNERFGKDGKPGQ